MCSACSDSSRSSSCCSPSSGRCRRPRPMTMDPALMRSRSSAAHGARRCRSLVCEMAVDAFGNSWVWSDRRLGVGVLHDQPAARAMRGVVQHHVKYRSAALCCRGSRSQPLRAPCRGKVARSPRDPAARRTARAAARPSRGARGRHPRRWRPRGPRHTKPRERPARRRGRRRPIRRGRSASSRTRVRCPRSVACSSTPTPASAPPRPGRWDRSRTRAPRGLARRLKDSEAGVREVAAGALGEIESRAATAPLVATLDDRDRRCAAPRARAGEIEDPRRAAAGPPLRDDDEGCASTSPRPSARSKIARRRRPRPRALDARRRCRRSCLGAGRDRGPRAAPALGRAVSMPTAKCAGTRSPPSASSTACARAGAAHRCARRRDRRSALAQRRHWANRRSRRGVRAGQALKDEVARCGASHQALSELHGANVSEILVAALADNDPEVRKAAAEALARTARNIGLVERGGRERARARRACWPWGALYAPSDGAQSAPTRSRSDGAGHSHPSLWRSAPPRRVALAHLADRLGEVVADGALERCSSRRSRVRSGRRRRGASTWRSRSVSGSASPHASAASSGA